MHGLSGIDFEFSIRAARAFSAEPRGFVREHASSGGLVGVQPDVAEEATSISRAMESEGNRTRRDIVVEQLSPERVALAKEAFTTRRVLASAMKTLIWGRIRPRSGDVVLARVDRVRQHARVERPSGRKATLMAGDEIIVCYADRYATDQFEAHVPPDLRPAHLVAGGGVASLMVSRSSAVRSATEITPVGLLGDERGIPLNVANFALPPAPRAQTRPPVICVLGTSMNAGKTTTIQYLVRGLHLAGRRPGTTKVTGTGSGGDYWVMIDAGAHRMLDFTDVGLASTFRIPVPVIERKMVELVDHLVAAGSGVVLVEIADGLLQKETARLLQSEAFRRTIDGVIFAAGDAMSAATGVALIQESGTPVIGVSGKVTGSPLAALEAERACKVPVFTKDDLRDPTSAEIIAGVAAWMHEKRKGGELPGEHQTITMATLLDHHSQHLLPSRSGKSAGNGMRPNGSTDEDPHAR